MARATPEASSPAARSRARTAIGRSGGMPGPGLRGGEGGWGWSDTAGQCATSVRQTRDSRLVRACLHQSVYLCGPFGPRASIPCAAPVQQEARDDPRESNGTSPERHDRAGPPPSPAVVVRSRRRRRALRRVQLGGHHGADGGPTAAPTAAPSTAPPPPSPPPSPAPSGWASSRGWATAPGGSPRRTGSSRRTASTRRSRNFTTDDEINAALVSGQIDGANIATHTALRLGRRGHAHHDRPRSSTSRTTADAILAGRPDHVRSRISRARRSPTRRAPPPTSSCATPSRRTA